MPLPDFVIVGAMRSGTTALNHWLRNHSQIEMAKQKEVHFFDWSYERGIDWYSSHWPDDTTKTIGEATPNYSYHPLALDRMHRDLPEAKLILVLRNPIDRAYSHYWLNLAQGKESLTFEDALDAEPARLEVDVTHRARFSYVDRGRYLAQIERIVQLYPPSSLGVFLYDDLDRDRDEFFKSVCRFLGVDAEPPAVDTSKAVNSYAEFRSLRVRTLAKRLPAALGRPLARLNVRPASSREQMSEATRERLRGEFESERGPLSELLDTELPLWR